MPDPNDRATRFPAARPILTVLAALLVLALAGPALANGKPFSFAVFGDSRIPAYAPYDRDNTEKLDRLVKLVTEYARAGAKPRYESHFNSATRHLEQITLPGEKRNQSRVIAYGRDGWPDTFVDRDGRNEQVTLWSRGQQWVYDNVASEVLRGTASGGGPSFVLHTGDIVYFGFQGQGADESPYWRDFDRRFLSRLPDGGPGGLKGRFFAALGNHEAWGDPEIVGFREMFPHLAELGFSKDDRTYFFDHANARFVFLDSGTMNPEAPAEWYDSRPGYEAQMKKLAAWLDGAVAMGLKHAFVTFHYPVFCRSGFGPLPKGQNPHDLLAKYADRIRITVFNGHVHATEAYNVDNVRYFVLGGGGGEQTLTANDMPAGYPEDMYWRGEKRQLDFNYLVVTVNGEDLDITLKRFRPNEMKPFSEVEMMGGTPGE